ALAKDRVIVRDQDADALLNRLTPVAGKPQSLAQQTGWHNPSSHTPPTSGKVTCELLGREVDRHLRAAPRRAGDAQLGTQGPRAVAHAREPVVTARGLPRLEIEADAIVLDADTDRCANRSYAHADAPRLAVLAHVLQRFLDDAKEAELDRRR